MMNPKERVDDFNRRFPVGTRVRYWRRRPQLPLDTVTRTAAYVLGDHTAVVFIDGVSGCIALDHLDVLGPPLPNPPEASRD